MQGHEKDKLWDKINESFCKINLLEEALDLADRQHKEEQIFGRLSLLEEALEKSEKEHKDDMSEMNKKLKALETKKPKKVGTGCFGGICNCFR